MKRKGEGDWGEFAGGLDRSAPAIPWTHRPWTGLYLEGTPKDWEYVGLLIRI